MFTSSRFAPPRTWSRATCTAPVKSPDSISRRKRIEPVTLVRSPTTTKPESGVISKGSRPLKRERGRSFGTWRAGRSDIASRICRMCSGPVPQHPPAALRKPAWANSFSSRLEVLPGKVASAAVDDGDRNEERELRRDLLDRGDRCLAVERVEDGLDEEQVDPAFLQTAHRLRVTVAKLVERDLAVRRILDLR